MLEAAGDIWTLAEGDALCITTNPIINSMHECVMGRGVALQAKQRFPALPKALAARIRAGGNIPYDLGTWVNSGVWRIFTLPTKYDWREKAEPSLIRMSLLRLAKLVHEEEGSKRVYLPRPGCGNGKLNWRDIKPYCEEALDDQFVVVDYQPDQRELL